MADSGDVVVIGAGVVGCAVAYELARRGAAVRLVDDRPAGMGATQASAGVLAPYVEARDGGPLLELAARSLDLFDTFVAAVSETSGVAVPYRRSGLLSVALQEDTARGFRRAAESLAARGVAADVLDARAVRDAEPQLTADARAGLLIPSYGFVAAAELTRALAVAAERSGARIVEHGRVSRISPTADASDLRVETDRGVLSARHVVLAAGSWAGRIEIVGVPTPVPVKPVRGQLLQLSWNGPPLRRVTWGERCYLVPWDDGTLLVGATIEDVGFDERTTTAGVRELIDAACELVPQGWTAALKTARAGLRPSTPDGLPVIGRSRALPGLVYATGHYRSGVQLAPLTAALVANVVFADQGDPLLDLVRPDRFGYL